MIISSFKLLQRAREANILKEVLLDSDGMCLHVAVQHKRLEVVLQILDAAASVGAVPKLLLTKTSAGESCLSEAVAYPFQDLIGVQSRPPHLRRNGHHVLFLRAV